MTTTKRPFEGAWDVATLEYRACGDWQIEAKFGPDEWSIGFLADGRYLDIFRPEDDRESGVWTFDETTGIITVRYDRGSECTTSKYAFDETTEGVYLYTANDERHIRPDRDTIIAHHAHTRQKLIGA